MLLVITAVVWLMASSGEIHRFDGMLLGAGMLLLLVLMVRGAKEGKEPFISKGLTEPFGSTFWALRSPVVNLVGGLIVLLIESRALNWGGVGLAHALGVDELVIGLTLMAVGTSLPELATTLAGTIKKLEKYPIYSLLHHSNFPILFALPKLRSVPQAGSQFPSFQYLVSSIQHLASSIQHRSPPPASIFYTL